jgi:DNA-binding NarL/FixJ family response regulator
MAGTDDSTGGDAAVIDVLLADDHPLILRGLTEVLAAHSEFRVVGAETDAHGVVDAALRLRPDVLVIDYSMPGRNGAEIVREVAARLPSTRALILSMHSSRPYVAEALASGALGYVLKCADGDEIVEAIRAVHGGRPYLSAALRDGGEAVERAATYEPRLRGAAYVGVGSAAGADPAPGDAREDSEPAGAQAGPLTRRELEVLGLVVVGHTSGEIADRLQIGRRTVESHRSSLMAKLGARNQIDLVREAVRRGLASLEED